MYEAIAASPLTNLLPASVTKCGKFRAAAAAAAAAVILINLQRNSKLILSVAMQCVAAILYDQECCRRTRSFDTCCCWPTRSFRSQQAILRCSGLTTVMMMMITMKIHGGGRRRKRRRNLAAHSRLPRSGT